MTEHDSPTIHIWFHFLKVHSGCSLLSNMTHTFSAPRNDQQFTPCVTHHIC